jgi:hypothetical protein
MARLMSISRRSKSSFGWAFFAAVVTLFGTVGQRLRADDRQDFRTAVLPLLQESCLRCHGPKVSKGELRLDNLTGDLKAGAAEIEVWKRVYEKLEAGTMPPREAPQPKAERVESALGRLPADLTKAGVSLDAPDRDSYPGRGNVVDHDRLFNERSLYKVEDQPLAGLKLPGYIDPLMPYLDRLTIVQGLNGKHVAPYHGAPYGALGGYKKERSLPRGETIDCALAQTVPGVVPLLALGWEALARMKDNPINYASSAWGESKAVPMYCDPVLAYKNLFGVAKPGQDRKDFNDRSWSCSTPRCLRRAREGAVSYSVGSVEHARTRSQGVVNAGAQEGRGPRQGLEQVWARAVRSQCWNKVSSFTF